MSADSSPPGSGAPGAGTPNAGPFALVTVAASRWVAQGPLTFATARRARVLGIELLGRAAPGALEIDGSGITVADSAGLAVLLDWLASAKRCGRQLRYTHLPPGLAALARISEVDELLARGV
jgi:phospholipid transport system transporter-binding protein